MFSNASRLRVISHICPHFMYTKQYVLGLRWSRRIGHHCMISCNLSPWISNRVEISRVKLSEWVSKKLDDNMRKNTCNKIPNTMLLNLLYLETLHQTLNKRT